MAALEPFYPERVSSRILGMGDMVSFVEEMAHKVDASKAEKMAKKLKKGKGFDLEDLREQMLQMEKMGGIASMLDKLPGMDKVPEHVRKQAEQGSDARRMVAIINSMTPRERRYPDLIKGSRKRRIAAGSGTQIQDVNRLLKQHLQMSKMMRKMTKGGGMSKMMRMFKGGMPPGMPPF